MIHSRFVKIKLAKRWTDKFRNEPEIYTTLEGENQGGSIKDYIVKGELECLLDNKTLKEGDWISEISAGSTALSLAYYAKQFKLNLLIFLPEGSDENIVKKLRHYGAEIKTVPMAKAYEIYQKFQDSPNAPLAFNQMFDITKERHYRPLAKLINEQLNDVDVLLGTVGTGHSLKGLASGLSQVNKVVSAEPRPDESVAGVRNLDKIWFGEKDPCFNFNLDARLTVPKSELFPSTTLSSSLGPMRIGESFQLALGALPQLGALYPDVRRLFIVGAKNKRTSVAKFSTKIA